MASWYEKDPETIADRAQEYASLAGFFLQLPTRELLEATAESVAGLEGQDDALGQMAAYFAGKRGVSADSVLDEVGADRTYLVHGMDTKGPRPPYGSLYAGSEMSAGMVAVAASYRRAGFALSSDVHDAPDFIGFELSFMAMLLDRVAQLSRDNARDQVAEVAAEASNFFSSSLYSFARAYVAECLPYVKTGYCRGYLMMLDEFMQSEHEAFA